MRVTITVKDAGGGTTTTCTSPTIAFTARR